MLYLAKRAQADRVNTGTMKIVQVRVSPDEAATPGHGGAMRFLAFSGSVKTGMNNVFAPEP